MGRMEMHSRIYYLMHGMDSPAHCSARSTLIDFSNYTELYRSPLISVNLISTRYSTICTSQIEANTTHYHCTEEVQEGIPFQSIVAFIEEMFIQQSLNIVSASDDELDKMAEGKTA